jgi:hypothetical protein
LEVIQIGEDGSNEAQIYGKIDLKKKEIGIKQCTPNYHKKPLLLR